MFYSFVLDFVPGYSKEELLGHAIIGLALVCSLFSSLTLIPLMSSRFLPATEEIELAPEELFACAAMTEADASDA